PHLPGRDRPASTGARTVPSPDDAAARAVVASRDHDPFPHVRRSSLSTLLLLTPLLVAQAPDPERRDVTKVYTELCATCHGPNMTGTGQAPSLLDSEWKFGGDDASIAHSIRAGQPAA